jgi:hypothetical protein
LEVRLLQYSIPLYTPDKGRAYSFLGTAAKRHGVDYFRNKNNEIKTGKKDRDLPEEEGYSVEDTTSNLLEKDSYEETWNEGKKVIKHRLKKARTKREEIIFTLILAFLCESKYISTYGLSYFLLKETNLKILQIYRVLWEHGLEGMIAMNKSSSAKRYEDWYKRFGKDNFKDGIYEFLYSFKDVKSESKRTINQAAKNQSEETDTLLRKRAKIDSRI